ncbi:heavy-metal-associated domain-containing protein [Labilibacter sediminis]|nr:heavy-metal-associated domain-containing protein [Labilibacter sediminis]
MKNLKFYLATMILFVGITTTFAQNKPKVKEVTYSCSIDCHSCKEKIMKNIPYEKGVKKVVVDMEKQQVTVSFKEDKNTSEGIEKAIEKLGYKAEVKPEEEK